MCYNIDTEKGKEKVITMLKCPNCGSTAQIRESSRTYHDDIETMYFHYICDCGQRFTEVYRKVATYKNGKKLIKNS